ncbi:MAG: DNA alkylation repair protein [Lachnospiraceae bacterium]|nr:DNA alkylation repair protein [Lachnospiraceae bacterium]
MDWKTELEPRLRALASHHQANFSSSLTPNCKPMLGVRLPELRKIAKEIAKEDYRRFLEECPDTYFEYETLQAYVLGYAKDDIEVLLSYADRLIPKIQDWSVNDSFCQSFSVARKHRERVFEWLLGYAKQEEEFPQRVVAVLLMSHFLVPEYIDRVFAVMDTLQYDGYYTKMGVAWCVATAYAKFPKETAKYLEENKLQDWTYNKAIQKMCESYRVGEADKVYWKQRKRK